MLSLELSEGFGAEWLLRVLLHDVVVVLFHRPWGVPCCSRCISRWFCSAGSKSKDFGTLGRDHGLCADARTQGLKVRCFDEHAARSWELAVVLLKLASHEVPSSSMQGRRGA